MSALTSLTLKQLATRVVVREDLSIKNLPNPLKRELEALALLPGNYTIIGKAKKLGKCGGGNLTREEIVRINGLFKEGKKKSALASHRCLGGFKCKGENMDQTVTVLNRAKNPP